MKKRKPAPKAGRTAKAGMMLGRDRFTKIRSVEGIVFTPEMKKRIAEFDRKGLSAEERRASIVRAYRKGWRPRCMKWTTTPTVIRAQRSLEISWICGRRLTCAFETEITFQRSTEPCRHLFQDVHGDRSGPADERELGATRWNRAPWRVKFGGTSP